MPHVFASEPIGFRHRREKSAAMTLPSPALRCAGAALLLSVAFSPRAQPADDPRQLFAREVYRTSAADIFHTAPHPLLRAVVVMRVRLGEDGRWRAELLRDNVNQPQMTRLAETSVQRLPAPEGLSEAARKALRDDGFVETWLFINDGRFALRSLALPQAPHGMHPPQP
jgi:protein TonB